MDDVKEFNKLLVKRDKTILGATSNLCLVLKARWPELRDVLAETYLSLLAWRVRLGAEGWMGYIPTPKLEPKWGKAEDVKITIVRKQETAIQEAEALAKEVEAKRLVKEKKLIEKKLVAEKKLREKKALAQAVEDEVFQAEMKENARIIAEQKAKAKAALAAKKAKKLAELEELKAAKLLELEALDELKEETEEVE